MQDITDERGKLHTFVLSPGFIGFRLIMDSRKEVEVFQRNFGGINPKFVLEFSLSGSLHT